MFNKKEVYKIPCKQYIELYEQIFNNKNHSLIAGATGSGKSVMLNNGILYLMNNNTPANLQFIFFDPKHVELSNYKNTRYCLKFCTEIEQINNTMRDLINLMNDRYKIMEKKGQKESTEKTIIVIIDELADLLTGYKEQSKQFERMLIVLLQKARACKIFFKVATQQPNRVILKAPITLNLVNRCALRTTDKIESKQIINTTGAESLPRYGQCIIKTPDLLTPKIYNVLLTPESTIKEICKAWTTGGAMVIK